MHVRSFELCSCAFELVRVLVRVCVCLCACVCACVCVCVHVHTRTRNEMCTHVFCVYTFTRMRSRGASLPPPCPPRPLSQAVPGGCQPGCRAGLWVLLGRAAPCASAPCTSCTDTAEGRGLCLGLVLGRPAMQLCCVCVLESEPVSNP